MNRSALLYSPGYRQRSRAAKAAAGQRCVACRRRKRAHAWQWWRPRVLHTHHLTRAPGSRLVVLCPRDHERAHRLDRASPAPLWLDTMAAIVLTRVVGLLLFPGLPIVIALILWRT